MAQPWERNWGTTPQGGVSVTPIPQSPSQAAEAEYKRKQQALAEQAARDAAAKAERERREWDATHSPDGSPKATGASNPAADRLKDAQTLRMLVDEYERVADPYMGETTGGEVWAQINPFERANTEGIRARETTAQNILPLIRRLMRTPGDPQAQLETSAYDSYLPSITATDDENKRRVEMLRQMADQIDPQGGQARRGQNQQPAGAAPPGVTPPRNGPGGLPPQMLRPWSPQDPAMGPASGGTRTTESNPELAAEYRRRLGANQSPEEILGWLRSQNVGPQTLMQAIEQLKYRQANPNVPIESYSITATQEVPLSGYEKAANAVGNYELPGGFSPGAYAVGAGQFLSGNTLDNLTSDPRRAATATDVMRTSNPGSTMAGEISGGILAGLTGEAGLARLGMASGLGRGVLADTAMGAANGAGMADGGNRLAGAARGGLTAAAGSLGGAAAMKAASRALSPTGGMLRPLYDAGVRPTPGQRFANSGTAGRILNTTEEALQSVPIVGQAIRGARQQARAQFQIGAFNEALSEIGEVLPKGMKPGTDPNAFTQQAFNRVYEQARSSMRMVADEELSNNLGQLAPDIATLGPAAQKKLKAIMANNVNNRLVNGEMPGGAYKKAVADLGRHTARLRNSPMAEDQALADVLDGVRGALDSAARRHSDPAAVELLDAADAGYARLVRIEEAAARRGGGAGEFSPANFDSAVQRTSGGVRSKAYSRGDALMQDYAKAGRSLDDTLPNSGTADRVMAGYAVGTPAAAGAVYAEPLTAALLGAIATAYAPGVRRATTGAMAPAGPSRKWIARQLEKRARLLGRVGAATGVASLPGTAPGR